MKPGDAHFREASELLKPVRNPGRPVQERDRDQQPDLIDLHIASFTGICLQKAIAGPIAATSIPSQAELMVGRP
jgi:hypothetical protein